MNNELNNLKKELSALKRRTTDYKLKPGYSPEYLLSQTNLITAIEKFIEVVVASKVTSDKVVVAEKVVAPPLNFEVAAPVVAVPSNAQDTEIIKKLLLILEIHSITFPTIATSQDTLKVLRECTRGIDQREMPAMPVV